MLTPAAASRLAVSACIVSLESRDMFGRIGAKLVTGIARIGVILLVCMGMAHGSTTLNFPRITLGVGTLMGVAIVNPSDQAAQVTFAAYGTNGQLLAGIENPVVETVQANQQFSRLTSELFPQLDPNTAGWFQATSSVDNLTGFFLFLDFDFTELDGADLPLSDVGIVFTEVGLSSGDRTELSVINPGNVSAHLQLQLFTANSLPVTRTLSLPAMGLAQLDVADFFQVSAASTGAYVTVNSNVPVAGFELVSNPERDLLGLNARSRTERLTHLYFPQLAVLGGFETHLGVVNNSSQAVILTVTAYQPDGSTYGTESLQTNPVTRSLDPGDSLLEDVQTLFGFSGDNILDGWLEVQSTAEAITGFVSYGQPQQGSLATVTASRVGQTRAIFSHIATVQGLFTGVAVLNAGKLAANVRILALRRSGEVLGSYDKVMPPGQRISMLINELIPEANNQDGGLIWLKSDLPVYLTSLFGTTDSAVLANIPPQAAPETYNPDVGIAGISVQPPLAVVQPDNSQTFRVEGPIEGSLDWKVNGVQGGDLGLGTVDPQGTYTAPSEVPFPQVVTVSAETPSKSAAASVDVVSKNQLFTSPLIVQSVAYMASLEKIYSAELAILSGLQNSSGDPPQIPAQEVTNSEIFETAALGLPKLSLIQFANETIAKMIPFRAGNGQEFLLLAAQTSGRVIRFEPTTLSTVDVATDLNRPGALVIDPSDGNLLVAEQDRVTTISRTQLEFGLAPAQSPLRQSTLSPEGPSAALLFPTPGADGITVDRCTEDVYISDRAAGV